jgi:hypothetical protein
MGLASDLARDQVGAVLGTSTVCFDGNSGGESDSANNNVPNIAASETASRIW